MVLEYQGKFFIGTSYRGLGEFESSLDAAAPAYACYQRERCKTDREHIQWFIQFSTRKRISVVRKMFAPDHVESALQPERAREYCKKADTRIEGPWERGQFVVRGRLPDPVTELRLLGVKQYLEAYPSMWRSVRTLQGIRHLVAAERTTQTEGWFVSGPTGCGKTTIIKKVASYLGQHDVYYKMRGPWWDRYDGQALVVMDDIPSCGEEFLNLLNHTPYQVPVKGGFSEFSSQVVWVVNNVPFEKYAFEGVENPERCRAIERRFVINHRA